MTRMRQVHSGTSHLIAVLLLRILLLVLLLGLVVSWTDATGENEWGCVPFCKCIWSSGRRTAECKSQDLLKIPEGLSKDTQHLDLTSNSITHLPDNTFVIVGLVNLQKLTMRDCQVKVVGPAAFSGLRIIIEIDLSHNNIRQLRRGTFNETERLRVILLNHNRLQKLDDELFSGLIYLQKVELSGNHLFQIGQRSFQNLPGLTTLALDSNNLTRLNYRSFEDLPKLGSLELRNNSWRCDCQIKAFRDWALQRNLYTKPTSCAEPPALRNKHWDEIRDEEFACMPQIELVGSRQHGDAGTGSAFLWCRASASPPAQLEWVHRQRVISNATKRPASERGYILKHHIDWVNLTIPEIGMPDKGEYVCVARNFGGSVERGIVLQVLGEGSNRHDGFVGLPLAVGLGIVTFLILAMALSLCLLCYCRQQHSNRDEKIVEPACLDHHGLGEQEKSLITAINPVVKPPRRYEAPSVTSHGTDMTELNRTLLDNDSVFADGVGSVMGVLANGLNDEDRRGASPELDSTSGRTNHFAGLDEIDPNVSSSIAMNSMSSGMRTNTNVSGMVGVGQPGQSGLSSHYGGSVISSIGTLPRNATSYRQYPPDLLAFSGGRNSSPTSQASTAPDSSRLPSQQQQPTHHYQQEQTPTLMRPFVSPYSSPSSPPTSSLLGYSSTAAFKTLPHPPRSSSVTPYSYGHHPTHQLTYLPSMSRHGGYGTIPRRPRAPSWSSCPPTSPTERDLAEPVYDNLGERKTANGCSVASLNLRTTPEPRLSMRNRPLPATPDSSSSSISSPSGARVKLTLPRAPPASHKQQLVNLLVPEGIPEWLLKVADKTPKQQEQAQDEEKDVTEKQQTPSQSGILMRKVPPRPPPKPNKKINNSNDPNGPVYEDEGEDGTEV
ncbi:uncharacterized protein LOC106640452 [Copidosoma floridanum]|uniref:uncharacterized protein LOC106640452 n=1 Tax=Copidosoma floridanum TaxID=29053 RepID=UPI0006C9C6E6|nr:uncharacterized protein LOC106640452 [Copidosoma floridanum]